ncbi:MAG: hypothetical protein N3B18_11120 [Desulfobacterota bacterium]|nr:hypothetical protein [Thermodesulfobacteriota bacterium]
MSSTTGCSIFFAFLLMGCAISSASAQTYQERSVLAKTTLIGASIIITPVYVAAKLPIAAAGAAVSAPLNFLTLKYAADIAETIALRTMYGDWYITPSVLNGDRPLHVLGTVD